MESLNILSNLSYTYIGNVVSLIKDYNMQDNQNQTHWIYAAAIMDSDGCFMICKHKSRPSALVYEYLPQIKITMINDGAINYILESTKLGYVNINGTRKSRPNSLPLYEYRITKSKDLRIFLKGIIPYLHNKKDRAEFMMEFLEKSQYGLRPGRGGNGRGYLLTEDELNYREQSYLRMRELNSNKVGATTKS